MRMPIRNRYFLFCDLVLLPAAAYATYVLRLEEFPIADYLPGLLLFVVVNLLITIVTFAQAGVYARYWRYASIEELLLLLGSTITASCVAGVIILLGNAVLPESLFVPRSIPFIYTMLAVAMVAWPRLAVRWLARQGAYPTRTGERNPVLIMGAGSAGAMVARELRQNPQLGIVPIGFVDDDPMKLSVRIHGIPVLGNRYDIARLAQQHSIKQLVIAMPTAPGKVIRSIVGLCERAGVRTKIIPGLTEMLDGKVSISQLRDVQIEDLLRRQSVNTDTEGGAELIRGRRVLVTGGGGSIGSELCRQVLRFEPSELIILGHGENSIFVIENELRRLAGPNTRISSVIADIRFGDRIRRVFEQYQPELVFHAAAHKHVPLMEMNPVEAITNNVLGTRNLLRAASLVDVKHFVMISTDKAVNPTSIMGASKRAAELLVLREAQRSGKPYVAVRFGNVLGSRGSVVLTFKQQIAVGGPITVTHPDMCRYFMTIPEAVQLVIQAATLGIGGEVFTLDMGEPVKIVDLARDMIELSGLEVGRDIDIVFSGLRPGEKLYEELFVAGESYERTVHEKIFIACNARNFVPQTLDLAIVRLEQAAQIENQAAIMATLHELIPQLRRPAPTPEQIAVPEPVVEPLVPALEPLAARAVGG